MLKKLHRVNATNISDSWEWKKRNRRNIEIQRDIFNVLKTESSLPDDIKVILENLSSPSDIYKLWIYNKDLLFDYLEVALWIGEVRRITQKWYSQIMMLSLNNDGKWVCWFLPDHALFMSRLRAHGMGEDLINKIIKAVHVHWGLPKYPERLSYINDEYIEYIFNKIDKPILCIDNITEYLGADSNTLNNINRFNLETFEVIVKLLQGEFYLSYIKDILPKDFMSLDKKQFERIFELPTPDLEKLIQQERSDMISILHIIRDRDFNIAINQMKYSDDDPETFWDAGLL